MGRVLEKESIIRETVAIEKQVIMSLFLIEVIQNSPSKHPTSDHRYGHGGKEKTGIRDPALKRIKREKGCDGSPGKKLEETRNSRSNDLQVKKRMKRAASS